jgi:hexosaminidase
VPNINSILYSQPISIDTTTLIKAVSVQSGRVMNLVPVEQKFVYHKAISRPVVYKFPPYSSYMANGINSLTDGIRAKNAVNKFWHGFYQSNLEAVVDLGTEKTIGQISLGCLQAYKDWIFFPTRVEYEVSDDGKVFSKLGVVENDISPLVTTSTIKDFTLKMNNLVKTRFIKIIAYPLADCPVGHPGVGKSTWIFADEIMVE